MSENDLIELFITDLRQTMKKTLTPFIEKIEKTNGIYQTLVNVMTNMPEYQELVKENQKLKEFIKLFNAYI